MQKSRQSRLVLPDGRSLPRITCTARSLEHCPSARSVFVRAVLHVPSSYELAELAVSTPCLQLLDASLKNSDCCLTGPLWQNHKHARPPLTSIYQAALLIPPSCIGLLQEDADRVGPGCEHDAPQLHQACGASVPNIPPTPPQSAISPASTGQSHVPGSDSSCWLD